MMSNDVNMGNKKQLKLMIDLDKNNLSKGSFSSGRGEAKKINNS